MTSLSPLQYATITGRFGALVADTTGDVDVEPDFVPLVGNVTLTPSVNAVLVAGATPPVTVLLSSIQGQLDASGYLKLDGAGHALEVLATDDPAINPSGFTWRVSFDFTYGGQTLVYPPFSIAAPKGTTIDLTTVAPVGSSNGTLITRGPAGTGIQLKGTKATTGALPATGNTAGDAWIVSANGHLYTWDATGAQWIDAGAFVGPQGPQGATGNTGATGSAGTSVLQGSGNPSSGTGNDGDLYVNSTSGDLFKKTAGSWNTVGNLKGPAGTSGTSGSTGPAGTPGTVWRTGTGAPSNGLGVDGDYYLSTTTGDYYQRNSGVYGIIANLKGPAGPAGPTGATGATGAQGPTGATGATGAAGAAGAAGPAGPDGVNSFIAGPGAVRLWPASTTFPTTPQTGDLFPHIE